MLRKAGVVGQVYCCDFFAPPGDLIGTFDVVISFGVAEHFQDTAECLRALRVF
jgi:2-polyprenyl-3-methyl-5-hydroxy-6-metoxy-1,4-benzoquinol methylase